MDSTPSGASSGAKPQRPDLTTAFWSPPCRSVMAEAWQYIYSGQFLILFLLAQMAPIFFEVWMEAKWAASLK